VIRANLLSRPRERVSLFGASIDADDARQGLAGLGLIALVAGIGIGAERMRLDAARAQLDAFEDAIARRAPERAAAKRLAFDVARYEQFAREAAALRTSGAEEALHIVRIGNAVPDAIRLTGLEHDRRGGYAIDGESSSLAAIGGAISHLGASVAGARAELISLDAREPDAKRIRFSAHLDEPLSGTIP
jgi:hypothetical protein